MARRMMTMAIAAAVGLTGVASTPAFADPQHSDRYYRDRDRDYRDREYRGRDRDYRYRCKRSKGTTGTIAGAAGGGLVANAIGGGTVGTIAGAVGGGLLGRHLDKKHDQAQNRRNGC